MEAQAVPNDVLYLVLEKVRLPYLLKCAAHSSQWRHMSHRVLRDGLRDGRDAVKWVDRCSPALLNFSGIATLPALEGLTQLVLRNVHSAVGSVSTVLEALPKLEKLDVWGTSFHVDVVGGTLMPANVCHGALKWLALPYCCVEGGIMMMNNLPSVSFLDASMCRIQGIAFLDATISTVAVAGSCPPALVLVADSSPLSTAAEPGALTIRVRGAIDADARKIFNLYMRCAVEVDDAALKDKLERVGASSISVIDGTPALVLESSDDDIAPIVARDLIETALSSSMGSSSASPHHPPSIYDMGSNGTFIDAVCSRSIVRELEPYIARLPPSLLSHSKSSSLLRSALLCDYSRLAPSASRMTEPDEPWRLTLSLVRGHLRRGLKFSARNFQGQNTWQYICSSGAPLAVKNLDSLVHSGMLTYSELIDLWNAQNCADVKCDTPDRVDVGVAMYELGMSVRAVAGSLHPLSSCGMHRALMDRGLDPLSYPVPLKQQDASPGALLRHFNVGGSLFPVVTDGKCPCITLEQLQAAIDMNELPEHVLTERVRGLSLLHRMIVCHAIKKGSDVNVLESILCTLVEEFGERRVVRALHEAPCAFKGHEMPFLEMAIMEWKHKIYSSFWPILIDGAAPMPLSLSAEKGIPLLCVCMKQNGSEKHKYPSALFKALLCRTPQWTLYEETREFSCDGTDVPFFLCESEDHCPFFTAIDSRNIQFVRDLCGEKGHGERYDVCVVKSEDTSYTLLNKVSDCLTTDKQEVCSLLMQHPKGKHLLSYYLSANKERVDEIVKRHCEDTLQRRLRD